MNTSETPTIDRRRHARANSACEASFECGDRMVAGTLVDLSFFGALFEMDADYALCAGGGLLNVPFGRDPEEAIRVVARVVYRRDRSVGLSWDALAPEDIIKVRRLWEGDPARPWMLMRPAHSLFFRLRSR